MICDHFSGIVQNLVLSPAVSSFRVLREEAADKEGYIRAKCVLSNGDTLEFAEYVRLTGKSVHVETYSFHWQTDAGELVRRWDNVEHHRKIETFPHHLHLSDGTVVSSDPVTLQKVLSVVEQAILAKDKDE